MPGYSQSDKRAATIIHEVDRFADASGMNEAYRRCPDGQLIGFDKAALKNVLANFAVFLRDGGRMPDWTERHSEPEDVEETPDPDRYSFLEFREEEIAA
jgi:hypothetical protein